MKQHELLLCCSNETTKIEFLYLRAILSSRIRNMFLIVLYIYIICMKTSEWLLNQSKKLIKLIVLSKRYENIYGISISLTKQKWNETSMCMKYSNKKFLQEKFLDWSCWNVTHFSCKTDIWFKCSTLHMRSKKICYSIFYIEM